jgi:hypothetical protein
MWYEWIGKQSDLVVISAVVHFAQRTPKREEYVNKSQDSEIQGIAVGVTYGKEGGQNISGKVDIEDARETRS